MTQQKDKCPECYGTGEGQAYPHKCPVCNGTGEKMGRPDREKIELAGITLGYALFAFNDGLISSGVMDCYRDTYAPEIIAFIEPLMEEAKREERERIINWVEDTDILTMLAPRQRRAWQALKVEK